MKNKRIVIISSVLLILVIMSSSTYAYWKWRSDNSNRTNVSFTIGNGFSCSADGGGNITQNDASLIPTNCTNSPYVIKRTITTNVVNSNTGPVYLDLWLDVKKLSGELSESKYFSYALTDSDAGCTNGNVLSRGTFNGSTNSKNNKKYILVNDMYNTTQSKTYYLYIWLDTAETNNDTQNKEFSLELNGECSNTNFGTANAPQLLNGLIPVKLSDSGDTVTTVAENDSTWYDYNKRKWANAILVNENTHTRSYYLSNPNTEVPMEDILAYYVWIPRYSYQVWQYTGVSSETGYRTIPIKFVSTDIIEEATQNGEWYTHPAFWWDDDSDGVRDAGEELSGIWVGKFETSHNTLSGSTTDNNLGTDSGTICNSTGCNNYTGLRILPNVESLRYNRLSNFFNASRFMDSNNNPFGLVKSNMDSHMMKNSEWGAVAYLSHSKYGINGQVLLNNQKTFITGCGAENYYQLDETSSCYNRYGSVAEYFQSTTGNVTGAFDMSGGAYEVVMGHLGTTTTYGSSGFSATYPLPDSKYYDNYDSTQFNGTMSSTNMSLCTLATCGGHALNETKSWYDGYGQMVFSSVQWLLRGGDEYSSTKSNVFASNSTSAQTHNYSYRLVLIRNGV